MLYFVLKQFYGRNCCNVSSNRKIEKVSTIEWVNVWERERDLIWESVRWSYSNWVWPDDLIFYQYLAILNREILRNYKKISKVGPIFNFYWTGKPSKDYQRLFKLHQSGKHFPNQVTLSSIILKSNRCCYFIDQTFHPNSFGNRTYPFPYYTINYLPT